MNKNLSTISLIGIMIVCLIFSLGTSAAAKTEWKMAVGDAAGGTQWEVGTKFAELLEKYSNGEVTAALFPNGQLGSRAG